MLRSNGSHPFVAAVFVLLALVGAACGVSREDAIEQLRDAGYEADSAECIMSSIESQGFESSDLADPIGADVEAAIEVAVEQCITAGDLAGLGADEEIRAEVILSLVDGGMAAEEAECIVRGIEGDGYSVLDLAEAGLEEQTVGGVIDALQAATLRCAGG